MKLIENKIKTLLAIYILGMQAYMVNAQQAPQYTQYMYNTMVLNSGYTGTGGKLEAVLLHRSQWIGIQGAPNNQSFSIHGRLGEKIGLGLSATNDKLGASNNIDVSGNFAYEITTGYTTRLSLGLNAGLDILNVDWSKGTYSNPQDPVFQENLNTVRPVLGVGAFFYSDSWYLGLSTHNLFNSELYNDKEALVTDRKTQYYIMGGYVFDLSSNLKFKPTFLTKHVAGAPITVDVSGNFMIHQKLTLGVAYRYDDAISGMAGFNITSQFFIGYAYDYTTTGLGDHNSGSHEIILKYSVFPTNKRALSPRFF